MAFYGDTARLPLFYSREAHGTSNMKIKKCLKIVELLPKDNSVLESTC